MTIDRGMKRIIASLMGLALVASAPAIAQENWTNQFSQGQARESVEKGKTVPLSRIFQSLKRQYGGYQLDADLYATRDGGREYVIEWFTKDGRRLTVRVDAESGRVLDRKGR